MLHYKLLEEEFGWYLNNSKDLFSATKYRCSKDFAKFIDNDLLRGKRAKHPIWKQLAKALKKLLASSDTSTSSDNLTVVKFKLKNYVTKLLIENENYLPLGPKLHDLIDNLEHRYTAYSAQKLPQPLQITNLQEAYSPTTLQFKQTCQQQGYAPQLVSEVLQPGLEDIANYQGDTAKFRAKLLDDLYNTVVQRNGPFKKKLNWHTAIAKKLLKIQT